MQTPVDPRLRPWWDRCKADHDRLVTIAGQHSTTYALKAEHARVDGLSRRTAQLEALVKALAEELAAVRAELTSSTWQPALMPSEQPKLPESAPGVATTKRGSKPAAAL